MDTDTNGAGPTRIGIIHYRLGISYKNSYAFASMFFNLKIFLNKRIYDVKK